MTLKQWEQVSGRKVNYKTIRSLSGEFREFAWIPDSVSRPWRVELWSLSDYRVTSVSGGTIWLKGKDEK